MFENSAAKIGKKSGNRKKTVKKTNDDRPRLTQQA